jgi:hypothetical protein
VLVKDVRSGDVERPATTALGAVEALEFAALISEWDAEINEREGRWDRAGEFWSAAEARRVRSDELRHKPDL